VCKNGGKEGEKDKTCPRKTFHANTMQGARESGEKIICLQIRKNHISGRRRDKFTGKERGKKKGLLGGKKISPL